MLPSPCTTLDLTQETSSFLSGEASEVQEVGLVGHAMNLKIRFDLYPFKLKSNGRV